MSWNSVPPDIREIASASLTRKQLDVLKLHVGGCGTRRIAMMLGIAEPTAREHLRVAKLRLRQAIEALEGTNGA